MIQPSHFIPLEAVAPDVSNGVPRRWTRHVTPMTNRPAPLMWKALFHRACAASPDLDWKGAGFVECLPEDLDSVIELLREITESTNAAFAAHLETAVPEERFRLLNEGINHFPNEVAIGGRYLILYP